jgi:hypothetical protein
MPEIDGTKSAKSSQEYIADRLLSLLE